MQDMGLVPVARRRELAMITVEHSLTNAPMYVVGVKRGWLPRHRLAEVPSLELAMDLIHNDAASLGHRSRAPDRALRTRHLDNLRCRGHLRRVVCRVFRPPVGAVEAWDSVAGPAGGED